MNLPTKITVARIAMIPLFIICFCLQSVWAYMFIFTALVFIAASATDFVDGYLARKNNMVTSLGKFLDPIADKVLVVAGLFVIVAGNYIPIPYLGMICSVIIMARELIIGLFRQIAALKNVVLAADKLGKWKTAFTMSAMGWLFFSPFGGIFGTILMYVGLVQFLIATVLTVVSGVHYIWVNKELLFDDSKASDPEDSLTTEEGQTGEQDGSEKNASEENPQ